METNLWKKRKKVDKIMGKNDGKRDGWKKRKNSGKKTDEKKKRKTYIFFILYIYMLREMVRSSSFIDLLVQLAAPRTFSNTLQNHLISMTTSEILAGIY